MDKYFQKVKATIAEKTGVDPEEIEESSYFEDDLNISELELHDIISAIEEEYAVEFEEDEKDKITSVVDLVDLLVEKLE